MKHERIRHGGEKCWEKRYDSAIVQTGSLPLTPEADYDPSREHRCTSALIWPEGSTPSHQNTVLTDPCFTSQGYQQAVQQFEQLHSSFQEIGWIFITHPHRDHLSNLINFVGQQPGKSFRTNAHKHFEGIVSTLLPGHSPIQKGLFFCSASQHVVCVSGDAILDEAWLRAWKYYWPNFYQEADILQTWESVAIILTRADVIIPGHGAPFQVTVELLEHLVHTFDQAEHAEQCPQVSEALEHRLEDLKDRPSTKKNTFSP